MTTKFEIASIHEVGQREQNEDSIFPNEEIESSLDNLFLVCDGVGGHAKGEIASDLICTQINSFFLANDIVVSDKKTIEDAVKFVETKFDSYIANNLESAGMASTLTLLHLHKAGATVAHIGDSRVYQFRQGEIVFRTKDHSLMQDLLDIGELTPEQAKTYAHKNQITRAMQGASVKKTKADVSLLTDIQVGDIFMLCSDGILESFEDDDELKEVFKEFSESVDTVNAKIAQLCFKKSKDNFSAYLVKINQEYIDLLDKPLIAENYLLEEDKRETVDLITETLPEEKETIKVGDTKITETSTEEKETIKEADTKITEVSTEEKETIRLDDTTPPEMINSVIEKQEPAMDALVEEKKDYEKMNMPSVTLPGDIPVSERSNPVPQESAAVFSKYETQNAAVENYPNDSLKEELSPTRRTAGETAFNPTAQKKEKLSPFDSNKRILWIIIAALILVILSVISSVWTGKKKTKKTEKVTIIEQRDTNSDTSQKNIKYIEII